MRNSYLVMGLRTPVGRFGKGLTDVPAPQLAGTVVRELVGRHGSRKQEPLELVAQHGAEVGGVE